MIFEFLKKLFWKADEGSRKRKSSDYIFECPSSKKHCLGNVSDTLDNNIKSNNFHNGHKSFAGAWSPSKNKISDSRNSYVAKNNKPVEKIQLTNQSTLYNTCRLNEKRQYSEMLMKFFPYNTQNVISDLKTNESKNDNKTNNIFLDDKNNCCYLKHVVEKKLPKKIILQSPSTFDVQYQIGTKFLQETNEKESYLSPIDRSPVEIIKTNTLRDQFSSKDVCKQNFIFQISDKYGKRIEQCQKEVQELKKITCKLAKHNQLLREAALEDQLNRSMRLCKVVLDEREDTEDYDLPELTPDMRIIINNALLKGPSNEILVDSFGLRITRKDIQTLAGLNWLNDEIINFYMNLLIVRGQKETYPSVHAMNTFFYPKLLSGGHTSLKRWTRKIDIFAKDLIVIPIHLGIHWCMCIIDFKNKSIQYFDSMGAPNHKCLQVLQLYLNDESLDKKMKPFCFQDWKFECVKDIPQQMNGSDCGVFSCMFAEYICSKKPLNFSQEDMPYFRNKMVYEILTAQLL